MSDLVEFLRARLDEEQRAAEATSVAPWAWETDPKAGGELWDATGRGAVISAGAEFAANGPWVLVDDEDAAHIARWEPIRVLTEIEAKRAILGEHTHVATTKHGGQELDPPEFGCQVCGLDILEIPSFGWCLTVRALAHPYADHPDFDPAWRLG